MSNLSRAGSALITIESSVEELEVPDLRRSSLTLMMMMMMAMMLMLLMMWPLAISEDCGDCDHDDDDHDDVAHSPLLCPRGSEVGSDRLVIWRMVAQRSRVALGSEEALVMKRRRRGRGSASLSGRSPAWPA